MTVKELTEALNKCSPEHEVYLGRHDNIFENFYDIEEIFKIDSIIIRDVEIDMTGVYITY